ncbi:MAG TPA: dTMP kinase [Bryobacteraceae bacterium]|jgi:dTMP kinase|nr:dTMP kinase [Bryobacteraceae bacterium]
MSFAGGLFLTFEGIEGCGKTTQMRLLVERLRGLGYRVTENQEPGTTAIGKQIRRVLLDPENSEMAPVAELLLMFASRAQAAAEIIRPALARGEIVVSDRFTDSTLAYQGYARGLGFDLVRTAHRLALDELQPQRTIAIDLDLETALRRAHRRNAATSDEESRIDRQSFDFHARVLEGYRRVAELEPERFRFVDGSGSEQEIAGRVWAEIEPLLRK